MSNPLPPNPRPLGPCRFFLTNRHCQWGERCKFSHDIAAAPADGQQPPPTRGRGRGRGGYRGRGSWRNGRPGNHGQINTNPATGVGQLETAINGLLLEAKREETTRRPVEQPLQKEPEESPHQDKIMGGYMYVRFGPGLEILTIRSADVTSPSVVIDGLPRVTSLQEAFTIAREFKPDLPPQAVRTFVRGDKLQAVVHYDDVLVADAAIKALDGRVWKDATLVTRALKPTSASDDVTKIECSWFQPAKAAYLQFTYQGAVDVAVAAAARTREIRGQQYRCLSQTPRLGQVRPYSVLLVGLELETTEDDLRRIFTFDMLKMKEPKFDVSREDVVAYVRSLFDGTKIAEWKIMSQPGDGKQKVMINVENADHARKFLRENDGKKHGFLGNTSLEINLSYNATFRIPVDIFKAVKEEVVAMEVAERAKERDLGRAGKPKGRDADENSPARVLINDRYVPVTVRIIGRGRPAVVRIKLAIQKLLRGETVCGEDGRALWDPALRGVDGQRLVREVKNHTGVHVNCDVRSKTMMLYGTQKQRQAARGILVEQHRLLLDRQHEIPLAGPALRLMHRGGLAAVQKHLGADKVIPDIPNKRLIVRCSPAEVETVKRLLRQPGANHLREGTANGAGGGGGGEDDCTSCFSPAEEPTKAPCGHVYCKLCASEYISSTIDAATYPIVCFGNEGTCKAPFSLAFLRGLLSHADMERHFTQSFSSYVQNHSKEYHFCPTPDCGTVYSVTTTGKVFTCSQCFAGICTTCCTESHDNQTCEEYQLATDSELGEKAFQQWRGENNVKPCPTCKGYFDKYDGCHHITCRCGEHWCWLCFETFPDGANPYTHIEGPECQARQRQQQREKEQPTPPALGAEELWNIAGAEFLADNARRAAEAEVAEEWARRARVAEYERTRQELVRRLRQEQEQELLLQQQRQVQLQQRQRQLRLQQAEVERRRRREEEERNGSGGFCAIM